MDLFRYAIRCFGLPLKLKYQDHGITPQWQNIRCAFNKLYTRHAEQLLAGRSALVVAVWAIIDYPTSDVVRRDHREAVGTRDRPGSG
jgi:hypothetical protein